MARKKKCIREPKAKVTLDRAPSKPPPRRRLMDCSVPIKRRALTRERRGWPTDRATNRPTGCRVVRGMPFARVDAGGVPGRQPLAFGGGAMTPTKVTKELRGPPALGRPSPYGPQRRQTSPGSIVSQRGTPGSPAAIVARLDDGGVMLYKDLAALPRDKAILDIERPDLMTYRPRREGGPPEEAERGARPQKGAERTTATRTTATRTPATTRHFHRPANGRHLYKKPPIYRRGAAPSALPAGKRLIIQRSKFPAARRPDPDAPSKMETERWPCPPSSAVLGEGQPQKWASAGGRGRGQGRGGPKSVLAGTGKDRLQFGKDDPPVGRRSREDRRPPGRRPARG
ncbi:actin-binding LIM protein 1-like isoform X4 [Stigmatopora nigra]